MTDHTAKPNTAKPNTGKPNTANPSHDDRLLDLLVDGELDQETQRRLLASLDEDPDGWRRCALAFLEAQSWGREFAAIVENPSGEDNGITATERVGAEQGRHLSGSGGHVRNRWQTGRGSWLAMAASLFVAFSLGLVMRGVLPSEDGMTSVDGPLVMDGTDSGAHDPSRVAVDTESTGSESANDKEPFDMYQDDFVTFVVDGPAGQPQRIIQAPLIEEDLIDPRLRLRGAEAVSPLVKRVLEERGYQTRTRRRYAPFKLPNGSRTLVPVDDVQITPVKYAAL